MLECLTRTESAVLSNVMVTLQSEELRPSFFPPPLVQAKAQAKAQDRAVLAQQWSPSEEYLTIIDTLLKSLKNIALEIANVGSLDKAGAIAALVPLLNGPFGARFQESIIPCLFNLCRMNRHRQEEVAVAGLIPFLMKIALEPSIDTLDHRPFALTMLCDFAYASAATRIELWRHDGIDFYTSLFQDPHWQGLALGAIANW